MQWRIKRIFPGGECAGHLGDPLVALLEPQPFLNTSIFPFVLVASCSSVAQWLRWELETVRLLGLSPQCCGDQNTSSHVSHC